MGFSQFSYSVFVFTVWIHRNNIQLTRTLTTVISLKTQQLVVNAHWKRISQQAFIIKAFLYGKYRNKSNEIQLQLHDWKSIFPVTITLIQIVIEFLSNYIISTVIVSKYFPYSKILVDYLSKYMVSYNSKPFNLNCYISVLLSE